MVPQFMMPTLPVSPSAGGGLLNMTGTQGMTPTGGLMAPPASTTPLTSAMGPWSQMAYQMAGSPHQGGMLPSVAQPALIPGSNPQQAHGVSPLLTGLLGTLAQNPSMVNSLGGLLKGLIGGGNSVANQNPYSNNGSSIIDQYGQNQQQPFDPSLYAGDASGLQNLDYSDPGSLAIFNDSGGGFSGAGGQAAGLDYSNPDSLAMSQPNVDFGSQSSGLSALGGLGAGLGIAGGLASGKPQGYASAALQAAKFGAGSNAFGANSSGIGQGAGYGMNALGIYSGLKQGGVAGDTNAAVNAAQLGSRIGAFGDASGAVGSAAGYVAAPLALYNEINNWQSGATGSDALSGAETGAAVGSIIPGIGTVIGGLLGGAAGAISSAFGNGRVDPENAGFENYTQAFNKAPASQQAQVAASNQNPYLTLAGLFDLRSNQIKGSIPFYNQYGRMGEQKFTTDLMGKLNGALSSGQISKSTDPTQAYNQVVAPWINSMGSWNDSNKAAMTGVLQQMTAQYLNGSYAQNWKGMGGDTPFGTPAPQASQSLMSTPRMGRQFA